MKIVELIRSDRWMYGFGLVVSGLLLLLVFLSSGCNDKYTTDSLELSGPPLLFGPYTGPAITTCNVGVEFLNSEQYISFKEASLENGETFKAEIAGDTVHLNVEHRENTQLMELYQGSISGSSEDYFLFTRRAGELRGILQYKGKPYFIKKCTQDAYLLGELNLRALPSEAGLNNSPYTGGNNACQVQTDMGTGIITVMCFYTVAARDGAGGDAAIQAEIAAGVGQTNMILEGAGSPARIQLTFMGLLDDPWFEASSNSFASLLDSVVKINEVQVKRNKYQADFVSLWVENGANCGLANIYGLGGTPGYSLVKRSCALANFSFAHELLHNFGLRHQCGESAPGNLGNRAVGSAIRYEVDQVHYRSVMAIRAGDYDNLPRGKAISGSDNLAQASSPACLDSNALILRNWDRINKLSSYRCGRTDSADVIITDNPIDTGSEPSDTTMTTDADLFNSHDVWIRRERDPLLVHTYETQSPLPGQKNYLYILLRNGSLSPQRGYLDARFCGKVLVDHTDSLKVQVPIGAFPGDTNWVVIPPMATRIVELPFDLAPNGEVGNLLIHYIPDPSSSEPMAKTVKGYLRQVVLGSNNIAARCGEVLYLDQLAGRGLAFRRISALSCGETRVSFSGADRLLLRTPPGTSGQGFLDDGGSVKFSFSESFLDSTSAAYYYGPGPIDPDLIYTGVISGDSAVLNGNEKIFTAINLSICAPEVMPRKSYRLIVEKWLKGKILGVYSIRIRPKNAF